MRTFSTLFIALVIAGCGSNAVREGGAGSSPTQLPWWAHFTPAEIILFGSAALAAAGVLCFISAIVALIIGRRILAGWLLAGAAGAIVGAPILAWVGSNLWWIALGVAGLGACVAVLLARKHIGWIEDMLNLDLNRNRKIGS